MTITLPLASAASLLYARISCKLALITGTTQPEVLWASSDHTFAVVVWAGGGSEGGTVLGGGALGQDLGRDERQ